MRLWDIFTETPLHTCKAHKHWILCIAWSPDGKRLASGCKNGQVCFPSSVDVVRLYIDPITSRIFAKYHRMPFPNSPPALLGFHKVFRKHLLLKKIFLHVCGVTLIFKSHLIFVGGDYMDNLQI